MPGVGALKEVELNREVEVKPAIASEW